MIGTGSDGVDSRPKTGVCYAFMRGECNRGDACKFNHVPPEEGFAAPQQQQVPPGYCFAFQRGECFRGDQCKYAHAHPAAGATAPYMNYGGMPGGMGFPPQQQRKPCFAFQRGQCVHGEACKFSHDLRQGGMPPYGGPGGFPSPHSQPPQQRFFRKPCFAFLNTGVCERGDACKFSHDPNSFQPNELGAFGPTGGHPGAGGGHPSPYGMPHPMMHGGGGAGGAPMGVCFAFQRGQCQRGDACRYLHLPANGASNGLEMNGNGGAGGAAGVMVMPRQGGAGEQGAYY